MKLMNAEKKAKDARTETAEKTKQLNELQVDRFMKHCAQDHRYNQWFFEAHCMSESYINGKQKYAELREVKLYMRITSYQNTARWVYDIYRANFKK